MTQRFSEFDAFSPLNREEITHQNHVLNGVKFSKLLQYRTDAILVRSYTPTCAGTITDGGTSVGGAPSARSLQRLVFLLNNCDTPMRSMLTVTVQQNVAFETTVCQHKKIRDLMLQRLRDKGTNQYCWVREHQRSGAVHWHVFTDMLVGDKPGSVDVARSRDWIQWTVSAYRKHGWMRPEFARTMTNGDNRKFMGCCRYERLFGNAGGRYAGKEGSKRYQKVPPLRWRNAGRWWAASRNVICSPTNETVVPSDSLERCYVELGGGNIEVAHKIQFNRGTSPESQANNAVKPCSRNPFETKKAPEQFEGF